LVLSCKKENVAETNDVSAVDNAINSVTKKKANREKMPRICIPGRHNVTYVGGRPAIVLCLDNNPNYICFCYELYDNTISVPTGLCAKVTFVDENSNSNNTIVWPHARLIYDTTFEPPLVIGAEKVDPNTCN